MKLETIERLSKIWKASLDSSNPLDKWVKVWVKVQVGQSHNTNMSNIHSLDKWVTEWVTDWEIQF